VAHRGKPTARRAKGGITRHVATNPTSASPSWPNIAELINDGEITVGVLRPVGCVAVASDGHNALAMLVRRKNETLLQLLTRLDQAIAKAYNEDIYTDEINPPPIRP
jgi:hypothetical protein